MSTKKEFTEIIEQIVLKLIRHPKTNLLEKESTSVSILKYLPISSRIIISYTFFQKHTSIHHLYSRGTYNTVTVALKQTNVDPNEEIGIIDVWQYFIGEFTVFFNYYFN